MSQLKEVLKFKLHKEEINALVDIGGYNTILDDTKRFSSHNVIIVFWDAFNFIEEFNSKALNLNSKDLKQVSEKLKVILMFL